MMIMESFKICFFLGFETSDGSLSNPTFFKISFVSLHLLKLYSQAWVTLLGSGLHNNSML